MINILIKEFKAAIVGRSDFFNNLRKEKDINKGLFYFIAFSFIAIGISLFAYTSRINDNLSKLYELTGFRVLDFSIALHWSTYFLILTAIVFFVTLITFFRYYVIHFFVKLVGGGDYKDTYNSLSFSITPGYIALIFFGISFILWSFDILFFNILGWILFLFYLALEIYSIYIRSKGLADTHEISTLNGFLCIYIYSTLALFIISFILLALLLIIYA